MSEPVGQGSPSSKGNGQGGFLVTSHESREHDPRGTGPTADRGAGYEARGAVPRGGVVDHLFPGTSVVCVVVGFCGGSLLCICVLVS